MRRNAPLHCNVCGKACKQGWSLLNHTKVCGVYRKYMKEHDALEDHVYDVELDVGMDEEVNVHAAVRPVDDPVDTFDRVHTIDEHFSNLDRDGTLDTEQVLHYANWGKLELTPKELEICRFLRSVEIGGGASDAASRASLEYARSLGGRGLLLPKTVRHCWTTIDKVCM